MRLYVSEKVSTEMDRSVIDVMALTRRRVTKAEFSDALVAVGLQNLDAVARHILGEDGATPQDTPPTTNEARLPEKPPVVAAIVTSERGVLLGQRHDGTPPWTFIAGEIEPGESPADAASREVKEETGLRVIAAEREIGRRVHPKTGRTMIYLACAVSGQNEPIVGDPDELAAVQWVSLKEAEQLLPGLFEPVHRYLIDQLSELPEVSDE